MGELGIFVYEEYMLCTFIASIMLASNSPPNFIKPCNHGYLLYAVSSLKLRINQGSE
jgi:hypothetical protein